MIFIYYDISHRPYTVRGVDRRQKDGQSELPRLFPLTVELTPAAECPGEVPAKPPSKGVSSII